MNEIQEKLLRVERGWKWETNLEHMVLSFIHQFGLKCLVVHAAVFPQSIWVSKIIRARMRQGSWSKEMRVNRICDWGLLGNQERKQEVSKMRMNEYIFFNLNKDFRYSSDRWRDNFNAICSFVYILNIILAVVISFNAFTYSDFRLLISF